MKEQRKVKTLAGKVLAKEVVTMRDIRLPEFDKNRRINQHTCLVFDNDSCNYDIILGTNFLAKTGIKLDCGSLRWRQPQPLHGMLDQMARTTYSNTFHNPLPPIDTEGSIRFRCRRRRRSGLIEYTVYSISRTMEEVNPLWPRLLLCGCGKERLLPIAVLYLGSLMIY
eukprot:scaffold126104_cov52-Cyclotella_meneghiniana.AAC.3